MKPSAFASLAASNTFTQTDAEIQQRQLDREKQRQSNKQTHRDSYATQTYYRDVTDTIIL